MARRILAVGFVTVSDRKSEGGNVIAGSSQNERGNGEKEAEEIDSSRPAPRGIGSTHPRLSMIFFEGERLFAVVALPRKHDHHRGHEGSQQNEDGDRPPNVPGWQRAA